MGSKTHRLSSKKDTGEDKKTARSIQLIELADEWRVYDESIQDLAMPLKTLTNMFLPRLVDKFLTGDNGLLRSLFTSKRLVAPYDPDEPFFTLQDRRKLRDNMFARYDQVAENSAVQQVCQQYGLKDKTVSSIQAFRDEARLLDTGILNIGDKEYHPSFTPSSLFQLKMRNFRLLANLVALTTMSEMAHFLDVIGGLDFFDPATNETTIAISYRMLNNTNFTTLAEWNRLAYLRLKSQDLNQVVYLDNIAWSYTSTLKYINIGKVNLIIIPLFVASL